jgi:hypothetical protein
VSFQTIAREKDKDERLFLLIYAKSDGDFFVIQPAYLVCVAHGFVVASLRSKCSFKSLT